MQIRFGHFFLLGFLSMQSRFCKVFLNFFGLGSSESGFTGKDAADLRSSEVFATIVKLHICIGEVFFSFDNPQIRVDHFFRVSLTCRYALSRFLFRFSWHTVARLSSCVLCRNHPKFILGSVFTYFSFRFFSFCLFVIMFPSQL